MNKKIFILIVIVVTIGAGAFIMNYAKQPSPKTQLKVEKGRELEKAKIAGIEKIKDKIKTSVENKTVTYRKESFYSNQDFTIILKNKDKFSSQLVENLKNRISAHRGKVDNCKVKFNSKRTSTILTCNVLGVISKTGNKYYARFGWLIRPLGLDFIDNDFKETLTGLSWEGRIDGVPTIIKAKFPRTGELYKAWAHPTGHCHAHVWWRY